MNMAAAAELDAHRQPYYFSSTSTIFEFYQSFLSVLRSHYFSHSRPCINRISQANGSDLIPFTVNGVSRDVATGGIPPAELTICQVFRRI